MFVHQLLICMRATTGININYVSIILEFFTGNLSIYIYVGLGIKYSLYHYMYTIPYHFVTIILYDVTFHYYILIYKTTVTYSVLFKC